jgi:hypothetical protein
MVSLNQRIKSSENSLSALTRRAFSMLSQHRSKYGAFEDPRRIIRHVDKLSMAASTHWAWARARVNGMVEVAALL